MSEVKRRKDVKEIGLMICTFRATADEFHDLRNLSKRMGRTKSEIIKHALAVAFPESGFLDFEGQRIMREKSRRRRR